MELNEYGKIADIESAKLIDRFSNLEPDVFQIMPNHIHAIVAITKRVTTVRVKAGAGVSPARTDEVASFCQSENEFMGFMQPPH